MYIVLTRLENTLFQRWIKFAAPILILFDIRVPVYHRLCDRKEIVRIGHQIDFISGTGYLAQTEKLPLASVEACTVLPFTVIVAPESGSPFSFFTFSEICCWAAIKKAATKAAAYGGVFI